MMAMTIHLSCIYDTFSSYRVYFSLMKSLAMIGLGLGHLVESLFHFALAITLVMSVVEDHFTTQNLEFIS